MLWNRHPEKLQGETMGPQIKQLRDRLGLTQEAFAQFIGVSFQTVNGWENGKQKPSRLAMEKIKKIQGNHERN